MSDSPAQAQRLPPKRRPNRGLKGGTIDKHRFIARLSAEQHAALIERAAARGMTLSEYGRQKLVADIAGPASVKRLPVDDRALLAKTLARLGPLGGHLNQLAHQGNIGQFPSVPEIEAALEAHRQLMNDLRAALGRQVLP